MRWFFPELARRENLLVIQAWQVRPETVVVVSLQHGNSAEQAPMRKTLNFIVKLYCGKLSVLSFLLLRPYLYVYSESKQITISQ